MACTWDDYFNKLRVVNNQIVRQYSNEVKNVLHEQLDKLWYQRPYKSDSGQTPRYIRTYELLESIACTEIIRNGKYGAKAVVYFDSNKLSHQMVDGNRWGQHISMDGTPVNNILAYWIDQGNGDSPYYQWNGVNYVQATLDEVKAIGYQTQKKLNSMGYNVEIR